MNRPEFLNGANEVFQKTGACLAMVAAAGACALANPKDVLAHGGKPPAPPEQAQPISGNLLPAIGSSALSADLLPASNPDTNPALRATAAAAGTEEETRPVTMQDMDRFLPVMRAATPDSPCNTSGYTIRFLPASDTDNDPTNDMRTSRPDGSIVNTEGRALGNCSMDLLNTTTVGPKGDNRVCVRAVHEWMHLDTSRSPNGYISADPAAPNDPWHDRDPNSLMSPSGTTRYLPCVRVTIDRAPQSIDMLVERAIGYVPALAKARDVKSQIVQCDRYGKSKTRRLCYSYPEDELSDSTAKNGTNIRIQSPYTKDDNPQFTYKKISTKKLRDYLAK